MSTQNKTRKRKWDLDDQGKEAPPSSSTTTSAPTPKSIKIETSSDASGSTAPSPTHSNTSESVDPNIAAAVAVAKINAMLAAKGIQVPNKPVAVASTRAEASENGASEEPKHLKSTIKESDMEFTQDITINDCKNRYLLTKGATQQMIQKETGADVTTRGKYYPEKSLVTDKDPPLYLHVTAPSKESLDAAVKKIDELMEQYFAPAPQTSTPRPSASHIAGRQFVQDKVFVGIEPDRTFNARAKIVGPQGAYVKHIQAETSAKVQLKGRGSGYVEPTSGTEAFEPLHIHITCWSQEGLEKAKKLCEDLISTVKSEWDKHKAQQATYPTYGRSPYPPASSLASPTSTAASQPPLPSYPPATPSSQISSTPPQPNSSTKPSAATTATNNNNIAYNSSNSSNLYSTTSNAYGQYPAANAQTTATTSPTTVSSAATTSPYSTATATTATGTANTSSSSAYNANATSSAASTSSSSYEDKKQPTSYHAVPPPDFL
nr:8420_t:CDS:10 [Entrophospora candida]